MLTDPLFAASVALSAFAWFAMLLVAEGYTIERRLRPGSLFADVGEKMGPIAAAGLAGFVAGNAIREAIRAQEDELLAAIESEIVRRDEAASREATINQWLTLDTSAWDEAIDGARRSAEEYREQVRRFHQRVAAEVLRAAPIDTGELRPAVNPTRHLAPPDGSNVMPCCGRTPYEVSPYDEMTFSEMLVTCPGIEATIVRDRSDEDDETFRREVLEPFGEEAPSLLFAPVSAGPFRCQAPQHHAFNLDGSEVEAGWALCSCGRRIARWSDGEAFADVSEWHGCYICRPDDPEASEEGCAACAQDAHNARARLVNAITGEPATGDDLLPDQVRDGLAIDFDPDATAPAWTSDANPPPMPPWQAWWTSVTFDRWREALDAHEEYQPRALLHIAEWYERPCDVYACPLCRPLRCRCDVDHETFRSSDPCEPCLTAWQAQYQAMIVEAQRDRLVQDSMWGDGETVPLLVVDGPLAGWIVGVRDFTDLWETYVGGYGRPPSMLSTVTYRRFHESRSLARLDEERSYRSPRYRPAGSGHYEPPTEQHGPGEEDRRSTQLPEGCVADVWREREGGYVPCGEEQADDELPFCAEHLARLRS